MIYRVHNYFWNKLFSLDRLLAAANRFQARLERLAINRRNEIADIEARITKMTFTANLKRDEAQRAENIKLRIAALIG